MEEKITDSIFKRIGSVISSNIDAAKGSDDAQQAKWIDIKDAMTMNLAFDHKEILHHADIYKS